MIPFVFYDVDGSIRLTGSSSPDMIDYQVAPSGLSKLTAGVPTDVSMRAHYVSAGVVLARTAMAPTVSKATLTADGTDSVTISGLPDPCVVAISGAVMVAATAVAGGSITLTTNSVGLIVISVTADPQNLPWSATLDAV